MLSAMTSGSHLAPDFIRDAIHSGAAIPCGDKIPANDFEVNTVVEDNLWRAHRAASRATAVVGVEHYDEVFQQAAIRLQRQARTFDGNGSLAGWLSSNLYETSLVKADAHLSQSRRMRGAVDTTPIGPVAHRLSDEQKQIRSLEQKELGAALRDLVEDLPPHYQEIIRRIYGLDCEKVSVTDLAAEMGCTKQNVSYFHMAALEKLRGMGAKKKLADFFGPESL